MAQFQIRRTSAFKKDLKRLMKQGRDLSKLAAVVDAIADGKQLEERHRDHELVGNRRGFRDCHIEPDWVLIYKLDKNVLVLTLTRTGTHAELEL